MFWNSIHRNQVSDKNEVEPESIRTGHSESLKLQSEGYVRVSRYFANSKLRIVSFQL